MIRWTRNGLVMMASLAAGVALIAQPWAHAQSDSSRAGVVPNVKVVSDKVPDVTSLEAWKASFISDEMTPQEKGLAIWRSIITFQYQDSPPAEYLQHEDIVYDPIKMFNVYGYAMCSPHSAHLMGLARAIGLEARGWAITGHSVPEIYYDGGWHHFDSSLMCYFLRDDGVVAGVDEIIAAVQQWYQEHPEFTNISREERDKKLRAFERTDNRQGWKLHGPKLIANSPSYDWRGWWPAGTHGWYATMQAFDGTAGGPGTKAYVYEYGASMGYRVNIQLRPGERIIRNWGNRRMHVNMDHSGFPDAMDDKSGFLKNNQAFVDKLDPRYPNLTNGRIGNGTHEYDVPLTSPELKNSVMELENLAPGGQGERAGLRVQDAARPGVLVVRMPSSYVYLSGTVSLGADVADGGQISVELSDNHGLDWKPVTQITAAGTQEIDLKKFVYRRYDYRLRFTLTGQGTGLTALKIHHDIQHSQRPLPALDKGDNKITFAAGPVESTITIEANNKPDHKGRQVTYKDWHVQIENLKENLLVEGRSGSLTVPVTTPGDMVRLRFGAYYRTWSDLESWEYQVSFDGGKTFKTVAQAPAQNGGRTHYVTVEDIPVGTRQALVRYVGNHQSGNMLGSFRIDADYTEPSFGFRPVKVTYVYEEDGQEKRHEHIARQPQEEYVITCTTRPTMKSITLELAE